MRILLIAFILWTFTVGTPFVGRPQQFGHAMHQGTVMTSTWFGISSETRHCGEWVYIQDTSYEGWVTVDTLGDHFKHAIITVYFLPKWIYGPIEPQLPEYTYEAIYFPCGGNPSHTHIQDRIDKLTGIRQRQKTWSIYKYIQPVKTEYDHLIDSLTISADTAGLSGIKGISFAGHGDFHDSVFYPLLDSGILHTFIDTAVMMRAGLRQHYITLDAIITRTITIGDAIYIVHRRKDHIWLTRQPAKP